MIVQPRRYVRFVTVKDTLEHLRLCRSASAWWVCIFSIYQSATACCQSLRVFLSLLPLLHMLSLLSLLPVGPQLLQPSGRFTCERPCDKRGRKHLQPGVCSTARINLACQQRLCWRYACWLTMVPAVGVHRAHVAPRLGQSISQALPPSGCEAPRGPETACGCV